MLEEEYHFYFLKQRFMWELEYGVLLFWLLVRFVVTSNG
jgi:hypothetical protein